MLGEPEEGNCVGRPRHSYEDNIKIDLKITLGGCGPDSSGSG